MSPWKWLQSRHQTINRTESGRSRTICSEQIHFIIFSFRWQTKTASPYANKCDWNTCLEFRIQSDGRNIHPSATPHTTQQQTTKMKQTSNQNKSYAKHYRRKRQIKTLLYTVFVTVVPITMNTYTVYATCFYFYFDCNFKFEFIFKHQF